MPDTISITELTWTLASAFGLWYAISLFRRAVGDLVLLRDRKINSLREYSAMVTVYTFFLFTFVEFGFVVAGIAAMFAPPPRGHDPVTPLQLIITVAFLMIDFTLAAGCYIIERRRKILISKLEDIEIH